MSARSSLGSAHYVLTEPSFLKQRWWITWRWVNCKRRAQQRKKRSSEMPKQRPQEPKQRPIWLPRKVLDRVVGGVGGVDRVGRVGGFLGQRYGLGIDY